MNGSILFAVILLAVAQIVAIVAGQARFYALCLDVTLRQAYLFLFLPFITFLIVGLLLNMGILPASLSNEVYSMSTFVGQLGMLYAVYKLMSGSCSTSLKVEETPA